MAYRLRVTEHAEELLDNLVEYLMQRLKSEQAARHLLCINKICLCVEIKIEEMIYSTQVLQLA